MGKRSFQNNHNCGFRVIQGGGLGKKDHHQEPTPKCNEAFMLAGRMFQQPKLAESILIDLVELEARNQTEFLKVAVFIGVKLDLEKEKVQCQEQ